MKRGEKGVKGKGVRMFLRRVQRGEKVGVKG